MNREEQVGAGAVGDRRSLLERDERVRATGHDHLDAGILQERLQTKRHVEDEVGLLDATGLGAGIVTAVASVDHDARHAETELPRQ